MEVVTTRRFGAGAGILLIVAAVAGVQSIASAQGKYAEVTRDDVLAMKLNHYFTPDKRGRQTDFEWRFSADGFVIRKTKGAIPDDLAQKFLGEAPAADEIQGKWRVDNGRIVFTDIKAGDQKGRDEVKLRVYRTAPTVIRLGEPQYVFEVP